MCPIWGKLYRTLVQSVLKHGSSTSASESNQVRGFQPPLAATESLELHCPACGISVLPLLMSKGMQSVDIVIKKLLFPNSYIDA